MTTESQVFSWLLLQHLPGITASSLRKLALSEGAAGDPELWLSWSLTRLRAVGLSELVCNTIAACLRFPNSPSAIKARRDQAWLAANEVKLVPITHPHYPPLLLEISDPPPLLFVSGDIDCLSAPQLAIVGSRNASRQGMSDAASFATSLAQAGFTITSGMAYGIDAAAHRAALDVEGKTIAVLGCGIDIVYPPEHRELALAIRKQGAMISEHPLGAPPRAAHFPSRNRIISGLSLGVLVVEAALQSGSLVTARMALEQNREVFAIPGSIHNPVSRGTNMLIRNGAKLVMEAQDILEELGGWSGSAQSHNPTKKRAPPLVLAPDEAAVLAAIGFQPTPLDMIMEAVIQPLPTVLALLGELELKGVVENRGGSYQRTV